MAYWTREIIRNKLKEWQTNKLSSQQICEWAQSKWWPLQDDYEDLEQSKNSAYESICRDMLWVLEDLDRNHLSKEDIPALLLYLDTQIGEYYDGKNRLESYFAKNRLDK